MNESICSPKYQYSYTCLPKKVLKALAKSYNKKSATTEADKIPLNLSKMEIHKMIKKKLSSKCKSEICFLRELEDSEMRKNVNDSEDETETKTEYGGTNYKGFDNYSDEEDRDYSKYTIMNYDTEKELIPKYYKPVRPSGKYQWLSTIDINHALKQYEEKHPDFEFIGPVPIDFDDFFVALKNFKLEKMIKKGKKKIGIVFNLDRSDQSGSHWVCLYFEFSDKRKDISFFDSVGKAPPHKNIVKFMDRLCEQAKQLGYTFNRNVNIVQHQKKGSECGVYCINFILTYLETKKSFEEIINDVIYDEEMNKRRNWFFR